MTSEAERLRRQIAQDAADYRRGDLHERRYQPRLAEQSVALGRAVVKEKLGPGEEIELEHHVVKNHLQLNQSILRDATQEAISLFLTNRRLFHLRSLFTPENPSSCNAEDGTLVETLEFCHIRGVQFRREFRVGEIAAGAGIIGLALLGYHLLKITGPILLGLGLLGMLHGALRPTRWVEVERDGPERDQPIRIFAVGKKSARALLSRLQAAAATRSESHDHGAGNQNCLEPPGAGSAGGKARSRASGLAGVFDLPGDRGPAPRAPG